MPTDIESSQLPSNVRVITINRYYPSGVSEIIARSACRFIGIVDESTVMKYPKIEGDRQCREWLEIKAKIYEAVGSHPHILGFKGLNEHGLLLQRAQKDNLQEYITSGAVVSFSRLLASVQFLVEAIAHIHQTCHPLRHSPSELLT